ncbi:MULTISPECIES: hypothetical protein [Pseudomonadaceae]|jgi:hypothetical protein|uniref:Uncharacterized protein n=1 Tax=Aquipseudomonas alcaligenes TaxID=43263 RepID=A0AA42N5V6_AQUAC|nr:MULTISPECIES: hypothetical protein [Pseudomonadaceae]TXJ03009.1 MAG: hypothetical protein E6Q31_01175 [Aquabacterium sp.]KQO36961.1 hypothetical protein ASF15_23580 [Pseudomonas sp. Leaf83]KXF20818.1 hypothetical protein AW937_29115 [Pseudomonas aeruginosa]KXF28322.1 hypothetical protein AW938_29435 [Pseudomonas aeruginosa]KXF30928.1 hypothetical protein AW939_28820 [Pseudomonas aeruginosa]
MGISYYLACLETRQYVWVGRLDPQGEVPVTDVEGSIAMFALVNRNKPLVVVSESHPILEEGMEWSPPATQETCSGQP